MKGERSLVGSKRVRRRNPKFEEEETGEFEEEETGVIAAPPAADRTPDVRSSCLRIPSAVSDVSVEAPTFA
jgi:hypothetical protein